VIFSMKSFESVFLYSNVKLYSENHLTLLLSP